MEIKKSGNKRTTYIEYGEYNGQDIPAIRYEILKDIPFVKDAFSTRVGGVSAGQYESMNFSVKMGDSSECVKENFERFLSAHDFQNPIMTDQTHTVNVKRVYEQDAGKNVFLPKDYSDVDGFVTDTEGLTLITTFADCVPLYFVDEKHKAIGLAHSGWKGTIGRIGFHTLKLMEAEFGTKPQDVKAAIGPSICADCYEVSKDLAEDFAREFECEICAEKIDVHDINKIVYEKAGGYYLNLWAANFKVLTDCGMKAEQIALPDICTCCNSDVLFSHRASKGKRGNLCAFLSMINGMG